MSDGDITMVLREMEFSPKERINVRSGRGGPNSAVSLGYLNMLGGVSQTDGRGLPIKLDDIIERRRNRVWQVSR